MHPTRILLALAACAVAVTTTSTRAAVISMNADDTIGTSSFNSGLHWADAAAPSAGNDYNNANFLLRTPGDANNYTFGGNSLTIISDQSLGSQLNDSLLYKGSASSTITVNNLTINGGALRQAQSETQVFTLAGNVLNVGANGMAVHVQGPLIVTSSITGSSLIRVVDNGSNDNRRTFEIANSANTYTGNIELPTSNRSRLRLDAGANLNFVPLAAGASNTVTGNGVADFNGVFNIDLTGADTTFGSVWQLVANSTLVESYGPTFSVAGFTDNGDDTWTKAANGTSYTFVEASGQLMIPEPATLSLAGLAALPLRRRRSR